MTLQPVVENAILHGILEKESKSGTIVLTGWLEESDIVILISDDGVGISLRSCRRSFPVQDRVPREVQILPFTIPIADFRSCMGRNMGCPIPVFLVREPKYRSEYLPKRNPEKSRIPFFDLNM